MKKRIIPSLILIILVVSLGSFVLADQESTGFGGFKEPEMYFEGAIQCGPYNSILVKAKENHWTDYCGEAGSFNPSKDGKTKAKEICDKYETQKKITDEYDAVKCPKRCPVKKLLNTWPFDSFTVCSSGLIFGSTIFCDSRIKFECAEEETTPAPIPPPTMPGTSEKAPEITFSVEELRCGQNFIKGEVKENYWFENFCRLEKKEFVKEYGDMLSTYGFDPSKGGESKATNLCRRSKLEEKLSEKYNSMKCPEKCSIKEKPYLGSFNAHCMPGLVTGSTISCSKHIIFNCEEDSKPQQSTGLPPKILGTEIPPRIPGIGTPPKTLPTPPSSIATPPVTTSTQPPGLPGVSTPPPTIGSSSTKSPCRLDSNFFDEIDDAIKEAKRNFDEMEDPMKFLENFFRYDILLSEEFPEIVNKFCKNPKMDLTEFMNFHVSEACDAINTGSPRCRGKLGKITAKCGNDFWNKIKEFGIDKNLICRGGRTQEELGRLTKNCLDLWEKEKEEVMRGLQEVLRSKCPPPDEVRTPAPTLPPTIPISRPTPETPGTISRTPSGQGLPPSLPGATSPPSGPELPPSIPGITGPISSIPLGGPGSSIKTPQIVLPPPKPGQIPRPPGVVTPIPPPGQTPTPGALPTPSQSPSPKPSPTPCPIENFADEINDAMNEAKQHFDNMENPEDFIGSLGPKILRPEIIANFCKNPNMDLTGFLDFHISEACNALNTGSPKCREKIGKIKAKCDESFWKEYGLDNLCNGGRSRAELESITKNCIDLWEKIKEEFMVGIHAVLRAKCPPKEPTFEPIPTRIREPVITPRPEPTLPPRIPAPVPSCPPDMIKVGENKCACPEGKVMVDKSCKTCAEATPAGYNTQKPNYEPAIMAALNKERCVSGARITLPGRMQRGPCAYYSTGEPKIDIDRTPPICQSPCGPVQCDTSRSCPCPGKPNCTLRVTCNWDGWQRAGEYQYIPKIAFR